MKSSVGSRFGREKFQIVYVNSFGRHRSGTVIHYDSISHLKHHKKEAVSDPHVCLSDRKKSGSTPPSPCGRKRPCLKSRATFSTEAKGPQSKGSEATRFKSLKRPKAKKVVIESLSSRKGSRSKKTAITNMFVNSQKPIGGQQETQGCAFEFSSPLENANNRVNRWLKRKSTAWLQVSKVISKMIEENECLRNRLVSCRQLPQEVTNCTLSTATKGHTLNQNSKRGGSCIDKEEAIFGWV